MTVTIDLLWSILLDFRKHFYHDRELDLISAVIDPEGFRIIPGRLQSTDKKQFVLALSTKRIPIPDGNVCLFLVDDELTVEVMQTGNLNGSEIEFLSFLLPFCVMPALAFRLHRAVSVVHLAQSIDGRMATINHNSKWISSSENLIYVHRMRALSDAILIGANTLHKDKPALTVRNVKGPNPVKIVIGNSAENFTSILESRDRIIHLVTRPHEPREYIETVCLHETSGFIHPMTILKELYKLGIFSVYVEGGPFTTSSFIREMAVDLLNFYIAPVILGSGISLEFGGIMNVEDALSLRNCRFMPMGNGMLINGHLKPANK